MPVPPFQELMLPALEILGRASETSSADLREQLARTLNLTDVDRRELLPNSSQPKFHNRTHWAVFYMSKAGLIEPLRRGVHRVTKRGAEVLRENPKVLSVPYLRRFPEFLKWYKRSSVTDPKLEESDDRSQGEDQPPNERLSNAEVTMRRHVEDELLRRIMERSPEFFERLVLRLLGQMGYGDGEHTGAPGDGGIDGIIREDKLGLDRIYIQAKRYDPERGVPARDVREFIGALEQKGARRGVFITTADGFPKESLDAVQHIEKRISLINGRRLVSLMFEHDIGVREKSRFVVKEVDEDAFSEE